MSEHGQAAKRDICDHYHCDSHLAMTNSIFPKKTEASPCVHLVPRRPQNRECFGIVFSRSCVRCLVRSPKTKEIVFEPHSHGQNIREPLFWYIITCRRNALFDCPFELNRKFVQHSVRFKTGELERVNSSKTGPSKAVGCNSQMSAQYMFHRGISS